MGSAISPGARAGAVLRGGGRECRVARRVGDEGAAAHGGDGGQQADGDGSLRGRHVARPHAVTRDRVPRVFPATVTAVPCASTHCSMAVWLPSPPGPPPPRNPPPPSSTYLRSPLRTIAASRATVGVGSPPLKPPIVTTGLPVAR